MVIRYTIGCVLYVNLTHYTNLPTYGGWRIRFKLCTTLSEINGQNIYHNCHWAAILKKKYTFAPKEDI